MKKVPIRTKDNFLVFGSPKIGNDEIKEVVSCMQSGWIGTGPKVHQFEQDFSSYKNDFYAVAVNSCTAAMHLSLIVAGIEPGDEVITTPLTFCSTVNAIIHAGGTPVLADIDPRTMNVDPEQIKTKITERTKVILPVHFAGRPCEMDEICNIGNENDLLIIEDCAHAIETEYKGKKSGTFGDLACFSFYVTKNVITGEGGMVITNNDAYANRLKVLALHGMDKDAWKRFSDEGYSHYFVTEAGFKYNMMDIQGSMGIHQLKQIIPNWKRRKEIWGIYQNELSKLPLILPSEPDENTMHAYHLYTILVDEKKTGISRDDFLSAMHFHNIGTGVHYMSLPEHPYYQKTYNWNPDLYPNAKYVGRNTVSLPLSPWLSDEDINDVIQAIHTIL